MRTLATVLGAVVAFVAGLVIGLALDRGSPELAEPCEEALAAADAVAAAVDAQWSTASAAVDAAQRALAESDYWEHVGACRSSVTGD